MYVRILESYVRFPDEAEFVSGPNGFNGVKLADVYVTPHLEYLQTLDISSEQVQFEELGESTRDQVTAALVQENVTMTRQE